MPIEALAHWGVTPDPLTLYTDHRLRGALRPPRCRQPGTLGIRLAANLNLSTFHQTNQMRYNPATDRALSIDEIAAQCKAAILKSERQHVDQVADRIYDEILTFYRWEDDVLIAA